MELWELQQMQSLPLEVKIQKTLLRIQEWYEYWDGQVYVSFSGGKDSTVLLALARQLYKDIPAVFADTGLEYPEIREFVKTIDNVVWLKPNMNFKDVILKYGYPIATKEQAHYVSQLRNNPTENLRKKLIDGIDKHGRVTKYKLSKCWYKLLDVDFLVSDQCCHIMKKLPFYKYERKTGNHPILGILVSESEERKNGYLETGCNAFDLKRPKSTPLGFWTEQDILMYLKKYDVPYSEVYGDIICENGLYKTTGCDRTGCMFCCFGVHLENYPNRFQRMQITHPLQHKYCMKNIEEGGLGLTNVLNYINIPYNRPKVNKIKYKVKTTDISCRADKKKLESLKNIYGNLSNTEIIDKLLSKKCGTLFGKKKLATIIKKLSKPIENGKKINKSKYKIETIKIHIRVDALKLQALKLSFNLSNSELIDLLIDEKVSHTLQ